MKKNQTTTTERENNRAAFEQYAAELAAYRTGASKAAPTLTDAAAAGMYDHFERVAGIVIESRRSKTPGRLWDELAAAWSNDHRARRGELVATAVDALDDAAAEQREEQHEHEQRSRRILIDDEERAAELAAAEDSRRAAERSKDAADTMRGELSLTYSERAHIVQAVAAQWLENMTNPANITADRLARFGVESVDELDEEQAAAAQAAANFSAECAAAQRAIRGLSHPDALRSYWTKATPATAEDLAAWVARFGNIEAKEQTNAGYNAMEYRPATKRRAAGWYMVKHGRTIARAQSVEEMAAAGATPSTEDTDTATEDTSRRELLHLVAQADKLTDKDRAALAAFTSDAARAAGQAAAEECKRKAGRGWSYAAMNAARYNAQSAAAQAALVTAYGMTDGAARTAWSRTLAKLTAAAKSAAPVVDWTAEQRRPGYIRMDTPAQRVDMIAAVSRAAAEQTRRPDYAGQGDAVQWMTAEQAEQHRAKHTAADPMTPEELKQSESRSRWTHAQRVHMEQHQTPAAFAALDAAAAAAVFLADMDAADIDAAAATAAEHESRRPNLAAALGDAKRAAAHAAHLAKVAEYHRRRAELNATRAHIVAEYAAAKADADKAAAAAKAAAKLAKAAANW